ncbi:DUF4330 domain-containing protein [Synechococcus sp. PCC 6312]|uniref:DUF4330 domain-containing protein n=1 Tax=Synechococcus sp. (strain ATCC 27167 / PCC 6312) TaxID=195253 RepID=UPI00029EF20C|nr:DUF4330 domain-containing protein [Synechococcus sp. PCC 6312]AFY62447.1 hypothetical protein Syn6312_3420 [Synechococcus sp. PCC 6312]
MALIDSQGRLFGKLSVLDVGAGLVLLLVVIGLLIVPGKSGTSIAQVAASKPIEVDVLVIGLGTRDAKVIVRPGEKANFIIRNQPYGQVDIKAVDYLPRTVTVSQPDGSVKALPDPRPEMAFSSNVLLTLIGKGQVTANGPVLGNSNVKVGTPVELDNPNYNARGTVVDVRVGS